MADLPYRGVCAMTRDQARLRMLMTYAETRSVSETAWLAPGCSPLRAQGRCEQALRLI